MEPTGGESSRGEDVRSSAAKRGSVSEDERNSVRVLRKRELLGQPVPNLPGQETYGFQRLLFHGLSATNFRASLVVMPIGQVTPVHDAVLEHVITIIHGVIEFSLDGETFALDPLDQIYLPRKRFYEYRNVALSESYFLNIVGPGPDGWPGEDEKPEYLPHADGPRGR